MRKTVWGEINKGLLREVTWDNALDNASEVLSENIERQIYQCFECQTNGIKHKCERCIIEEEMISG